MPEFKGRIHSILQGTASAATVEWNQLMRDIIYGALNDDIAISRDRGISMKLAGLVDSQLRVLAAEIVRSSPDDRERLTEGLAAATRERLERYLNHPEANLLGESANSKSSY